MKNRYETFQLLLRAPFDSNYTVKTTTLMDLSGNEISENNVKVYYEGFVSIQSNFHANGFAIDDYPEVLFPIENVIENKDNRLIKDQPIILFVEIFIPKTCKAGEYKGKIIIEHNERTELEYTLNVLDITLPDEVTHKSLFYANSDCIKLFEEEFSQAIYDKYVQATIDHRLGPTELVPEFKHDEGAIKDYAQRIYEQVFYHKMSYSNIPSVLLEGVKPKSFNPVFLKKYLVAILEKSLEKKFNLFDYLGFYNWCIDEPFCWEDNNGRVYNEIQKYENTIANVCEEYANDERLKNQFGKKVLQSMKKISHVITDYYERTDYTPNHIKLNPDGTKFFYDVKKVSLCPKYEGLATPKKRKPYKGGETWWYNCGTPNSPYPAYHIDESGFAPRILPWMMQDYQVKGNLYWSMTACVEMFEDGTSSYVKDPYALRRGYGSNGEGILLYPGKPYGVNGPITSLRLKAIRSGYEDYELIGQLKKAYQALGVRSKSLLKRISLPLYYNARIDDGKGKEFDLSVNTLYGALLLVQKYGITIESSSGKKLKIKLKGNLSKADLDGKEFVKEKEGYSCVVDYRNTFAALSITINSQTHTCLIYVGKGIKIYTQDEWRERIKILGEITTENHIGELLDRLNITPKNGSFTLEIPKKVLREHDEMSFTLLSNEKGKFKIKSNGKTITADEFESPDNVMMGSVRRIKLRLSELVNGKIEVELEDLKTVGLREFCFN